MIKKRFTTKNTKSAKKSKNKKSVMLCSLGKSAAKKTLVQLRDLEIQRGKDIVLTVPKLDIMRGEVLAIIGPNGAGKSTLGRFFLAAPKPKTSPIRCIGAESRW